MSAKQETLHPLIMARSSAKNKLFIIKYNHRRLKDADVYFFFNEGEQALSLKTTVKNTGTAHQAQLWDTATGKVEPWADATFANGKTVLPLELPAWGTKVVVISDSSPPPAT